MNVGTVPHLNPRRKLFVFPMITCPPSTGGNTKMLPGEEQHIFFLLSIENIHKKNEHSLLPYPLKRFQFLLPYVLLFDIFSKDLSSLSSPGLQRSPTTPKKPSFISWKIPQIQILWHSSTKVSVLLLHDVQCNE